MSRTPTHFGGSHRDTYELNTANMTILDDPQTTSAITDMTFNNGPGGGQTGYINASNSDENSANGKSNITNSYEITEYIIMKHQAIFDLYSNVKTIDETDGVFYPKDEMEMHFY